MKKSGILLEIEKAAEASGSDLTFCVFSLEDTVTHLPVTDPSKILTIEKQKNQVDQNGKPWLKRAHVGNFFVILLPLGGHKVFVASLVDPFLVEPVIFHQYPSTYSTGKFHDIHGIQGSMPLAILRLLHFRWLWQL